MGSVFKKTATKPLPWGRTSLSTAPTLENRHWEGRGVATPRPSGSGRRGGLFAFHADRLGPTLATKGDTPMPQSLSELEHYHNETEHLLTFIDLVVRYCIEGGEGQL